MKVGHVCNGRSTLAVKGLNDFMKEKLLRLLLTGCICFALVCSKAAGTPGIGVTLINYTFDTVGYGYTITINALVTNHDTLPFTGIIDFGLRTQNYNLSNSGLFNKPPYSNGNDITLYPGETVPSIFSVEIDPVYFAPGPDVVVVWPICTQPVSDSVVIPIVVEAPNAIAGTYDVKMGYIIINGHIFVTDLEAGVALKQVRIYNIMGQQIAGIEAENVTDIALPAVPHGVYLAEFITTGNRRRVIRYFN